MTAVEFDALAQRAIDMGKEPQDPKLIYMAGACNSDSVLGVLRNLQKGLSASALVQLAFPHTGVYSPWTDHTLVLQMTEEEQASRKLEDYYASSMNFLRAADIVVLVPGWSTSKGTNLEVKEAGRAGIPVCTMLSADLRSRDTAAIRKDILHTIRVARAQEAG